MSRPLLVLLALVALLVAPCRVEAQIYLWRDADGRMVLSDTPRADGGAIQKTFEVERARGAVRVTRPSDAKSARFDGLIDEHASQHGVDPDLVRAVIQVESAFNPLAVSNKGAMGLMQLMPGTARSMGVSNPFDPRQNIFGGSRYLRFLANTFEGDLVLTVAAYNAGEGAVMRYRGVPPYDETRRYVQRVIQHYYNFRNGTGTVRDPR